MAYRFNPPPGWPSVSESEASRPGWQPDPSWPPAPPGWQLWIDDGQPGPFGGQTYPAADYQTGFQAGQPGQPGQYGQPDQYGQPGQYGQPDQYGQPGQFGGGQYPPPAFPQNPYGGYAPMPGASMGTSGLAIAALISGILCPLIGLILGIVALSQIRRTGQGGRGLAIAGIVISSLWIVLFGTLIAIGAATTNINNPPGGATAPAASSSAAASSSSADTGGTKTVSPLDLTVGQCFQDNNGAGTVMSVTALPCTQSHNAQVFAKVSAGSSGASYPGDSAVIAKADRGCKAQISKLDKARVTDTMTLNYFRPGQTQWILGSRDILCLIESPDKPLTSSLLKP